jgi:hypothetical protein
MLGIFSSTVAGTLTVVAGLIEEANLVASHHGALRLIEVARILSLLEDNRHAPETDKPSIFDLKAQRHRPYRLRGDAEPVPGLVALR